MTKRMVSSLAAVAFVHASGAYAAESSSVLSATASSYFTQTGPGSNHSVVEVEGFGVGSSDAAFGVVDFRPGAIREGSVGAVDNLSLSLALDAPGSLYNNVVGAPNGIAVYLNTGQAADITPSSKLVFDPSSTDGVLSQFTSLSLLGHRDAIVSTGNGSINQFSFKLTGNAPAQQAVEKALTTGGPLQLVLAPAVDYVFTSFADATTAGLNPLTGKEFTAPQLNVGYSLVPEPNSALLLGLGSLVGLFLLRRRRLA